MPRKHPKQTREQKHPGMSFDQHIQYATRLAVKNDIKQEVTEATMIIAKETKNSLLAMRVLVDAIRTVVKGKLGVSDDDFKVAVWEAQERQLGLEILDTGAEKGNTVRLRVKEEKIGAETEDAPVLESFVIIGDTELTPEIEAVLVGAKAGETKVAQILDPESKDPYKVTLAVDRVYKRKA